MYKFGGNLNLIGYSDSDWAGSIDEMKSTSGYAFLFGSSICLGYQKSKVLLINPLPKPNMFQHLRLLLKLFGLGEYLKTLVKNKKNGLFCIVITSQQLQLPRIQSAMKDQSIFPSIIILSEKHKRKAQFTCIIVRQETNLLTSSPKHFLEKNFAIFEEALELSNKCIKGECWN